MSKRGSVYSRVGWVLVSHCDELFPFRGCGSVDVDWGGVLSWIVCHPAGRY